MSKLIKIAVAAMVCGVLVAGAFIVGRPSRTASPTRPERALGPDGDAASVDPDLVVGTGADPVPVVGTTSTPGLSAPLRSIPASSVGTTPWVKRELSAETDPDGVTKPAAEPDRLASVSSSPDGALQTARGPGQMPAPAMSVGGLSYKANGRLRLTPPDPNGDVGATQYVQAVNIRFAVFNKTNGHRVAGPTTMSSLFKTGGPSSGSLCRNHDDGDPVVVYDPIADRWVLTQFALDFKKRRFAECIAVSKTGDATGQYWVYQFLYPKALAFNDYPKFGVWPDGYYASFNQFHVSASGGFSWAGAGVIAYDRVNMLSGNPATQIYFDLLGTDPNLGGMLPSDLDGSTAPPAGTPNVYMQMDPSELGYPQDQLELWAFHADFATPASSTFTGIYSEKGADGLATAAFNPFICGTRTTYCIPQKGTKTKLDTLEDRLMFRLQYRNLGTDDNRLTVTQTVRAGKAAGIRWYVLQGTDAFDTWTILDQGTYAPADGRSRWMGSAALDESGNLAVGYSLSGSKAFPSIAYAGKDAADVGVAAGLTQAERRGFTGTGSEAGRYGRWGDYSDLSVDPTDDCTFFYTNEYYGRSGQWGWRTRVLTFKFPGCV